MKTMSKAFGVATGVSMAVLALGCVATSALAEDVRIPVADLNLSSPEGRAQFDARVTAAASGTCSVYLELARRRACMDAFREAADENLSEQMQRVSRRQGESIASARR